ncbi:MAG: coproporphyrinogen III oxidase, partial [Proteobacteria bacterium]|nr:coproporphyrinogen III oxidase [Pseudomonadota bacterium]
HNIVYWTGGDYAGIGPGAHGRVTRGGTVFATEQIPGPENWLAAVEADHHGTRRQDQLSSGTRVEELIMMGLRLTAGIGRAGFTARTGMEIEDALEPRRLRRLIEGDFVILDEAGLRATPAGRLRLNAVLAALMG